jgi:hypothetical protein
MTHLSSEQMSSWTLGERSPEVERHLQACHDCNQEIVRLQDGLLGFKHSVENWAQQSSIPGIQIARPPARRLHWQWAAASVVAISVVLLPLYLDMREAQREAASARDSLLLTQINARLARTVPQSMEKLMELMNDGKESPK